MSGVLNSAHSSLVWFPPHSFFSLFVKTCVELLHEERVQVPVRRCAKSVHTFVESWEDTVVWNECGDRVILILLFTFP